MKVQAGRFSVKWNPPVPGAGLQQRGACCGARVPAGALGLHAAGPDSAVRAFCALTHGPDAIYSYTVIIPIAERHPEYAKEEAG